MTSEGESKPAYTLEEAMQHIYSIDEGAYKRLTGRTLEEFDFVLVKGVGDMNNANANPTASRLERMMNSAILAMYRNMKLQGIVRGTVF